MFNGIWKVYPWFEIQCSFWLFLIVLDWYPIISSSIWCSLFSWPKWLVEPLAAKAPGWQNGAYMENPVIWWCFLDGLDFWVMNAKTQDINKKPWNPTGSRVDGIQYIIYILWDIQCDSMSKNGDFTSKFLGIGGVFYNGLIDLYR